MTISKNPWIRRRSGTESSTMSTWKIMKTKVMIHSKPLITQPVHPQWFRVLLRGLNGLSRILYMICDMLSSLQQVLSWGHCFGLKVWSLKFKTCRNPAESDPHHQIPNPKPWIPELRSTKNESDDEASRASSCWFFDRTRKGWFTKPGKKPPENRKPLKPPTLTSYALSPNILKPWTPKP